MSYTKGKWFNNGGRICAQQGDDIREICDVGLVNHQSREDTANARLIVAAPDLSEVCEDFAKGWSHFCDCIDFGNSALDADAIRWMNEVPPKIGQAIKKAS